MKKQSSQGDESQNLASESGECLAAAETADGVDRVAGRELDTLVAERVMGWKWMSRACDSKNANPYRSAWLFPPDSVDVDTGREGLFGEPIIVRNGIVGPFREYDGGRKEQGGNLPHYSTDIAAAMEVVEKMREQGFIVSMMSDPPWTCEMAKPSWSGSECWTGATLPLAICLAALAAVDAIEAKNGDKNE